MPRPRPVLYEVRYAPTAHRGCHWKITAYPNGKRHQLWFPDEKAAKSQADDFNQEITAHGTQDHLPQELRLMALHCSRRLEVHGKNLLDATDYYLKYLESLRHALPLLQLTDAIRAEFQRRLRAGEISQRHWAGMRYSLRKLDLQFGQSDAQTLQAAEIKAWMAGSCWSITTRNGLLANFSNAFNIATEQKLLNANPLLGVKRFASSKVSKKNNPKFLTVPQMIALLNNADASLIPYLAICAFAGLRSAEAKSLTWGAVELERKKIVVPENVSKTGQERTVSILSPNLTAWLLPAQFASNDYIYPRQGHSEQLNQLLRQAKQTAGLWPWKPKFQNALRKSFCSYHYEMHGTADRTAEYAGHDIRMLIKVYRHAVGHSEAVKYWQIFP